jgi:CRP-like cAMP-binding protein/L-ascorbate metabolism protein UlaG (beta-lactamase superfamily)
MLALTHPDGVFREAVLEDMQRRTKFKDVIIRALGLQQRGVDALGECPLWIMAMDKGGQHPWQQALLTPGGDCPIGLIVNTYDYGKIVLIHEVFCDLTPEQQAVIRRYAVLTLRGRSHERVLLLLNAHASEPLYVQTILREARRRVQVLDPSVLFSPDGGLRIELGSLSQTTKNLLREGVTGEYLFILPKYLFESRTNYVDVEFLVYLNFFVRYGTRTRIAGTARQKAVLEHLLRLTIFGLFDPHAPTQPSFEAMQERYHVSDLATYTLFHMLYEKYGVRGACCAGGPGAILDLDAYVDFVLIDDTGRPLLITPAPQGADATSTPRGPYSVHIVPLTHGIFEVSIVQADGGKASKSLETHRPTKRPLEIPAELCRAIRFATDRPRFGVTPLGTSHGFDPVGDLTSFVIWVHGLGILVDPSPEALEYLDRIGVSLVDLPYVFLTHVHSDHDGGLISKLLSGHRTTIIAADVVFRLFIEKAKLVTGQDFQQARLVEHIPANPGPPVLLDIAGETVTLQTRWNLHTIPTNGFRITVGDKTFGYAGDTQYDPTMLQQMYADQLLTPAQYQDLMYFFWTADGTPTVDLLYHEAGIPPIHTDKRMLTSLSEAMRERTFLVHVADKDVPADFGLSKPALFTTTVLVPSTSQARNQTLVHTLGLVSYLYDAPLAILEELQRRCTPRVFEPEEIIIRAGQVQYSDPLAFYVVADGQADVIDNDRVVSRLFKGDSFGEWGISHQRGYRVSDVMARRTTQVIELDEAAYRWLVEQHPVIQPRIGKIREITPKLQGVRLRARQKSAQDPTRMPSVIEEMNSGQLSAFAVFSEVRRYQRWDTVVVEGEDADGLYILLSGHLHVSAKGKSIGELTEAEVFGELGLLELQQRMATVRVASADAEIMFMSRQNFNTLLQKVPAFSFGVRTVAAQRREQGRDTHAKSPRSVAL